MAIAIGCWQTATKPVWTRRAHIMEGDYAFHSQGDIARAHSEYQRASDADELSPEPYERLANLEFQKWVNSAGSDGGGFDFWQQFAVHLNPNHFGEYLTVGEWRLAMFDRTRSYGDAFAAAQEFAIATDLYPNSPRLQSLAAEAWWKAWGDRKAIPAAQKALELHEINHAAGHIDKELPPERVALMRVILSGKPFGRDP